MKSKKFDAAEKHFAEKELKLRREKNAAEGESARLKEINSMLIQFMLVTAAENQSLKQANDALKGLHQLTDENIQSVIAHAQSLDVFCNMQHMIKNVLGR